MAAVVKYGGIRVGLHVGDKEGWVETQMCGAMGACGKSAAPLTQ